MRSKSKQKGSHFERVICKQLSLWVSGGEREDLFWRSAMSGGRATVGKRKGKDHAAHAGDISATHSQGHVLTDHWYIECKAYRNLAIESAMIKGIGTLAKFWRETCYQATQHKKMPMLIAKQNNTPILMIVPKATHLSPYGTLRHSFFAHLARLSILEADVFEFDQVMQSEFGKFDSPTDFSFLKPRELQRILSADRNKTPIKPSRKPRVRIKERKRVHVK